MVPRLSSKSRETKTWILLLGIAAVIGLDLGFTILIGNENTPNLATDTFVRSPKLDEVSHVLPDQGQTEAGADDNVAEMPKRTIRKLLKKANTLRSGESTAARRQIAAVHRQALPRVLAMPQQFEPTIIRVKRSPQPVFVRYVVPTSENISLATAEVRRPRTNNLVSKLSPLVKKPWQWMRSIVSKFR